MLNNKKLEEEIYEFARTAAAFYVKNIELIDRQEFMHIIGDRISEFVRDNLEIEILEESM